ncbi:MAG: flagellar basal body rod protein [Curvibacter sp.]|nr:flagellar basal body rod protein [Curvibacter sp.]
MSSISAIGLSGLQASQLQLNAAANNIANLNTDGYHREVVNQQADPNGGTSASITSDPVAGSNLAQDLVNQMSASYSYKANLQTIQTQDQMMGSLLSVQA